MIEVVNPKHPDKVADRIAGALVDLAYMYNDNPKVAVEVLIGHGDCNVIIETSEEIGQKEIEKIVHRIAGENIYVNAMVEKQDEHLADNQRDEVRCGDNGIFTGTPLTIEEVDLFKIANEIYNKYPYDGKYILDNDKLIICQSNVEDDNELFNLVADDSFNKIIINPLGYWTGGTDVDTGATNRKLGSDMGHSVSGGGLCVSGDTEYLGDDLKWHRIDSYINGRVAQWEDGQLSFVTPNNYIHNTNDKFIHFWNDTKLDMKLTYNHEILYITSKGHYNKHNASYVADKLLSGKCRIGEIPHTFTFNNVRCKSKYDSDNMYKLQVAFCADGTINDNPNAKWTGRISVKKQYKIDMLRELLRDIPHMESHNGTRDKYGYIQFYFNPQVLSKSLYECFYNEDWSILKDEVFKWDGDYYNKVFRTTRKEDADFIQLVLSSYGDAVGISIDDRIGRISSAGYVTKSICYCVYPYKSRTTDIRPKAKKGGINTEYLNSTEDSYCFNVPSHNLVLRRNNKIFITGNCGKDLSKADVSINIYAWLKAQQTGKQYNLSCAIGDTEVDGRPYSEIVEIARRYINDIGGFEKFSEWGFIKVPDIDFEKYGL